MADKQPILDLDTLVERPTIRVDGKLYEIRSHDELSVLDHHRLVQQGKRLDELMARPELDADSRAEVGTLLYEISDFVMVGVPAQVRAKLSDAQRASVAEVFTVLPTQQRIARAAAAIGAAATRTGASRPRASNASTAATPPGGSPRPR